MRLVSLSTPLLNPGQQFVDTTQTHMPLVTSFLAASFFSHFWVTCIMSFLPVHIMFDADIKSPLLCSCLIFAIFPAVVMVYNYRDSTIKHDGPITSSFTKRKIYAGFLIMAVSTLGFGYVDWFLGLLNCTNMWMKIILWLFFRALQALGSAMTNAYLFSYVAERFEEMLGHLMKLNQIVIALGSALGPPIGAMLYQAGGFSFPFTVGAVVVFLASPIMFWDKPGSSTNARTLYTDLVEAPSAHLLLRSFWMLRSVSFLSLGTIVFGLLEPSYALHAVRLLYLKSDEIGYLLAILFTLYSAGGMLIGNWGLGRYRAFTLNIVGGWITSLSLICLGIRIDLSFIPEEEREENLQVVRVAYETLMLGFLGLGLAILLIPCLTSMKDCVDCTVLERVMVLYNTAQQVSMIIGPLLGALLTHWLGFHGMMTLYGFLLLTFTILIQVSSFFIPPPDPVQDETFLFPPANTLNSHPSLKDGLGGTTMRTSGMSASPSGGSI